MPWPLNRLSQPSFPLLLEDALQPEDLLSEGEGRVMEADALICCLATPAEGPLHRGGEGWSGQGGRAIPQGRLQASLALRPQACGASSGFLFLIGKRSQPCPAHSATRRLLGKVKLDH